jgi:hypothetical protein
LQLEFSADSFARDFFNGPGDAVIFDNIKVVQRTSPPLTITQNSSGQPLVSWPDPAVTLQSATNVVGPYADVTGATSPYPVPASQTPKFFQTRW